MPANTQGVVKDSYSWENPVYAENIDTVIAVRTAIAGEQAVKNKREEMLPNPCVDPSKRAEPDNVARYNRLLEYAEFDNVGANTLESLIGAMFRIDPVVDGLGTRNEYLDDDADGNGQSLSDAMELTASECLQMRYEGLLAEYSDLAGLNATEISVADQIRLNLRASIKHYPRESIVNWSFMVVNGVKKLNMLVLREAELQSFDPLSMTTSGFALDQVQAYLILGLDENGKYFQRRYVERGPKQQSELSEAFYPLANGQPLDFIPFEFVFSSKRKTGDIPSQLGYLYPIIAKTLHRYRTSALQKESLRVTGQPTSYSKGWTEQTLKQYKQATGNEFINLGAGEHIPLFGDNAEIGYLDWDADNNAFTVYMEANRREIIALGGIFNDEADSAATATEAAINVAEEKGTLSTLAKNIESSYSRVIKWCALFNGGGDIEPSIKLTRDFSAVRLTAVDRAQIMNEYLQGAISRSEMYRQLERGGVLQEEIDVIIDELEREGGPGNIPDEVPAGGGGQSEGQTSEVRGR